MPSGIYKRTQEMKDNIGKAQTGKKRTQEVKDNMSKSHTGLKHTQEVKDNMSKSHTGLKHTQEAKDSMSKSAIGKHTGKKNWKWRGDEYQDKNGRWFTCVDRIRYCRARYVAVKCLGRELIDGEIIHHINENKSDDRLENLYLFPSNAEHSRYHRMKNPPILISNLNN